MYSPSSTMNGDSINIHQGLKKLQHKQNATLFTGWHSKIGYLVEYDLKFAKLSKFDCGASFF